MKFVCDQCKTKYQISDDKVAGKTVKMKCRKCGHIVQIKAAVAAVTEKSTASARAALVGATADSTGQHQSVATGELQAASAMAPNPAPGALASSLATSLASARPPPPRPISGTPGALPTTPSNAPKGAAETGSLPPAVEEWYAAINGVPVGPIRVSELRRKAAIGMVTEETLVWQEGFDEWRPIKAFPELAALIAEAAVIGRPSQVPPATFDTRAPPPPRPLAPRSSGPPRPLAVAPRAGAASAAPMAPRQSVVSAPNAPRMASAGAAALAAPVGAAAPAAVPRSAAPSLAAVPSPAVTAPVAPSAPTPAPVPAALATPPPPAAEPAAGRLSQLNPAAAMPMTNGASAHGTAPEAVPSQTTVSPYWGPSAADGISAPSIGGIPSVHDPNLPSADAPPVAPVQVAPVPEAPVPQARASSASLSRISMVDAPSGSVTLTKKAGQDKPIPWIPIAAVLGFVAFGVTAAIVVTRRTDPAPVAIAAPAPSIVYVDRPVPVPAQATATAIEPEPMPSAADPTAKVAKASGRGTKTAPTSPNEPQKIDLGGLGLGGPSPGPSLGQGPKTSGGGSGSLSSGDIEAVVARYRTQLKKACWEKLDVGVSSVKVTAKVVVGGDGHVQSVAGDGNEPSVTACIEQKIRTWVFPPSGGTSTVQIPVSFVRQ